MLRWADYAGSIVILLQGDPWHWQGLDLVITFAPSLEDADDDNDDNDDNDNDDGDDSDDGSNDRDRDQKLYGITSIPLINKLESFCYKLLTRLINISKYGALIEKYIESDGGVENHLFLMDFQFSAEEHLQYTCITFFAKLSNFTQMATENLQTRRITSYITICLIPSYDFQLGMALALLWLLTVFFFSWQ